MSWSLDQIRVALAASWSIGTCDPVDVHLWHEGNRSRGQCGATAMVVQDLLGGELVLADVFFADGTPQGVHYWNRLPDGVDVDLTLEQFTDDEVVTHAQVVTRYPGPPVPHLADHYLRLLQATLAALPPP